MLRDPRPGAAFHRLTQCRLQVGFPRDVSCRMNKGKAIYKRSHLSSRFCQGRRPCCGALMGWNVSCCCSCSPSVPAQSLLMARPPFRSCAVGAGLRQASDPGTQPRSRAGLAGCGPPQKVPSSTSLAVEGAEMLWGRRKGHNLLDAAPAKRAGPEALMAGDDQLESSGRQRPGFTCEQPSLHSTLGWIPIV